VTYLLITYNQVEFVEKAFQSAVEQTYEPVQLLVADDGSTDGTYELLQDLVRRRPDAHDVRMLSRDVNLGIVGNLNRAMRHAEGSLIVVAAGDDVSMPDRVATLVAAAAQTPDVQCLGSAAVVIDRSGSLRGPYLAAPPVGSLSALEIAQSNAGLLGCTAAWTREVFSSFGPLDEAITREDVAIPFRGALLGSTVRLADVLVQYRLHDNNVQFRAASSTVSTRELHAGIKQHLPGNVRNYAQMQRDVEVAVSNGLLDDREAFDLRHALDHGRQVAELEYHLADLSKGRQVAFLLRHRQAKVGASRWARWCLTYLAPRSYIRLVRRQQEQLRRESKAGATTTLSKRR